MTRRIPILMFHQIAPAPDPAFRKYAITPAVFAEQMDWIAKNGFVPVQLGDVFGGRRVRLPRNPIVLTFDDGFQDCFDHAVPILLARGFTATFFVVAGLVGKRSGWLARERGVEYPLMDWGSMRALADLGFECGSHTLTHPRLADLTPQDCSRELRDSRSLLEDGLGRAVTHLAYPFGSFNEPVRAVAADCGYDSACTVRPGLARQEDDPLTLARVPVNGTDPALAFAQHLRPRPRPIRHTTRIARRVWRALLSA